MLARGCVFLVGSWQTPKQRCVTRHTEICPKTITLTSLRISKSVLSTSSVGHKAFFQPPIKQAFEAGRFAQKLMLPNSFALAAAWTDLNMHGAALHFHPEKNSGLDVKDVENSVDHNVFRRCQCTQSP